MSDPFPTARIVQRAVTLYDRRLRYRKVDREAVTASRLDDLLERPLYDKAIRPTPNLDHSD
jgi:hypothetical protein